LTAHDPPIVSVVPVRSAAAEAPDQLVGLIYELLDAHADTDWLIRGPSTDLLWQAHLHYLRDLQRTGREILARATNP
jgi:hypothetical protein